MKSASEIPTCTPQVQTHPNTLSESNVISAALTAATEAFEMEASETVAREVAVLKTTAVLIIELLACKEGGPLEDPALDPIHRKM